MAERWIVPPLQLLTQKLMIKLKGRISGSGNSITLKKNKDTGPRNTDFRTLKHSVTMTMWFGTQKLFQLCLKTHWENQALQICWGQLHRQHGSIIIQSKHNNSDLMSLLWLTVAAGNTVLRILKLNPASVENMNCKDLEERHGSRCAPYSASFV